MATIVGTAGADVLRGTSGNDQIFGRGGGDLLVGASGDDILEGGAGADTLVGGTEDARLAGGPGSDTVQIDGTPSDDRLFVATGIAFDDPNLYTFSADSQTSLIEVERLEVDGLAGADRLEVGKVFGTLEIAAELGIVEIAGLASLRFDGGRGGDTLDGAAANGPLLGRGGPGDDRLIAGAGDDTLFGGGGRDTLWGGDGADNLDGGAGDDIVIGGGAPDVLRGGTGADVFRYLALPEPPAPNVRLLPERITDFSQAQSDRIDLRAVDARPDLPGNQAFLFANGIDFINYQPGTVTTSQSVGDTFVTADAGDRMLTIRVEGLVNFTEDDFIL